MKPAQSYFTIVGRCQVASGYQLIKREGCCHQFDKRTKHMWLLTLSSSKSFVSPRARRIHGTGTYSDIVDLGQFEVTAE